MINKKPHTEFLSGARGKIMLCALCVLLYVLLFFLFTACVQNSHDDPDDPGFEEGLPTEVRITLSSRSANATRADKGDGVLKDPTKSVEKIHDWWIAFINENNGDVKILYRNQAEDKTTYPSDTVPGAGFEAETFRTVIPSGKYRIYAFANIPRMSEETFSTNLKNNKLQSKYIKDFVATSFGKGVMQWPSDVNIPMTKAINEAIIKNTVEEAFNIEVIRTVAKVEFEFSNPSTDKITLKSLEFSPITSSEEISISPNDKFLGVGPNNEDLLNKTTGTLTFDMNNTLLAAGDGSHTFDFYCKESLPKENGGPFTINLTVRRNDATSDETKTLHTTRITYINRNDWIYIPIRFNNWVFKWKLHFYPPIGGYPPVFEQSADGSSLKATLTTGGEFELYPVEVTQNGIKYTVNDANMKAVVKSGNSLFIKEPELIDNPNEDETHPLSAFDKILVGELHPKVPGDATIEITFFLKDKDGNDVEEEKTCTFTIHRQNSSLSN